MTNAPILPERDTPAHYVLHSLIRGGDRRRIDWRKPSEIAYGKYANQTEVVMALADLVDAGVVAEVTDRGRGGYQVLALCECPPERSKSIGVHGIDKSDHNRLTKPVFRWEACADQPVEVPEGFKTELPSFLASSVLGTEWGSLPSRLEGSRLSKRQGRPCNPDSAMGLALYWEWKIQRDADPSYRKALSPVNLEVLRAFFSRWLRQGIANADDIRGSIDRFMARPYGGRIPPWRQYLRDAQHLLEDYREQQALHSNRSNRDYWVGQRPTATTAPTQADLDYWLGRPRTSA